MNLSLIVAMGRNREIGQGGKLPWPKLFCDLRWFVEKTTGKPLIMGRKTFESLPKKPLAGRDHLVLTSDPDFDSRWRNQQLELGQRQTVFGYSSVADLLAAAAVRYPKSEIVVCGGSEIYRIFLPLANTLYLTRIWQDYPLADTYFPEPVSPSRWDNGRVVECCSIQHADIEFVIHQRDPGVIQKAIPTMTKPMNSLKAKLRRVSVQGYTVQATQDADGTIQVGLLSLCFALSMVETGQRQKLDRLGWKCGRRLGVSASGVTQPHAVLSLDQALYLISQPAAGQCSRVTEEAKIVFRKHLAPTLRAAFSNAATVAAASPAPVIASPAPVIASPAPVIASMADAMTNLLTTQASQILALATKQTELGLEFAALKADWTSTLAQWAPCATAPAPAPAPAPDPAPAATEVSSEEDSFFTLRVFCDIRRIRLSPSVLVETDKQLADRCSSRGLPVRVHTSEHEGKVNLFSLSTLEAWVAGLLSLAPTSVSEVVAVSPAGVSVPRQRLKFFLEAREGSAVSAHRTRSLVSSLCSYCTKRKVLTERVPLGYSGRTITLYPITALQDWYSTHILGHCTYPDCAKAAIS